jgi:hypothetical protein
MSIDCGVTAIEGVSYTIPSREASGVGERVKPRQDRYERMPAPRLYPRVGGDWCPQPAEVRR